VWAPPGVRAREGGPGEDVPGAAGWLFDVELLEQIECVRPRFVTGGFAGVDRLERRAEHLGLDDRVIRTLELRGDTNGTLSEDFTDGSVVVELGQFAFARDSGVGLCRNRGGEGAGGLECLDLLGCLNEPRGEFCSLFSASTGWER